MVLVSLLVDWINPEALPIIYSNAERIKITCRVN